MKHLNVLRCKIEKICLHVWQYQTTNQVTTYQRRHGECVCMYCMCVWGCFPSLFLHIPDWRTGSKKQTSCTHRMTSLTDSQSQSITCCFEPEPEPHHLHRTLNRTLDRILSTSFRRALQINRKWHHRWLGPLVHVVFCHHIQSLLHSNLRWYCTLR